MDTTVLDGIACTVCTAEAHNLLAHTTQFTHGKTITN